jgi:Flp pilus assembly protein TadG
VNTSRTRSGARKSQSGAAALEFGLIVGTVLIPLVLGIIQYGWYFYVAQTTGGAATHVARRMAVGDCWGSGQALSFVQNEVASAQATFAVDVSPPAPTSTTNTTAVIGSTQLTVTVTSKGDLVGFLPMPNGGTVSRTVRTMIEDTTSSGTC